MFKKNLTICSIIFLVWIQHACFTQVRASSAPYISGDTFRSEADFIYDETSTSFDPALVKAQDVIFVKGDMVESFFESKHSEIENPYILITHNSDESLPGKFASYLDDSKIIVWFSQNVDGYQHEKLIPIPIGIANQYWEHGSIKTLNVLKHMRKNINRPFLLVMNFAASTHPERQVVQELFEKEYYCFRRSKKKYIAYLTDFALAKFILSPRGNGLDCHRTWEALYMGAVPIVKTSPLDPMFKDLPVLIVKDWKEINEEMLKETWDAWECPCQEHEKLFFPYWKSLIDKYRHGE